MVRQRLKIEPEAVDLIMAAAVLSRQGRLQHAGHYAFLALGSDSAKESAGGDRSHRFFKFAEEVGTAPAAE